MIKIITLFKSNPGWIPEYVYKLQRQIEKNVSIPYEFVCLSDVDLDCPTLPLKNFKNNSLVPAFWYKMQLFRPDLGLNKSCLFFDIDTIIKGNIDSWFDKFKDYDFLMSHSPFRGDISCSFCMWWNNDFSRLWHSFKRKSVIHWNRSYNKYTATYGDQGFISKRVNHQIIQNVLGPDHGIVRITKNESSDNSKILIFGGRRKPWEMIGHPDIDKFWI